MMIRVNEMLGCCLGPLPCRYLGLQLGITKLTRVQWKPMLDCVRDFLEHSSVA